MWRVYNVTQNYNRGEHAQSEEFSLPTPKYSHAVAPGAERPVGEDVLGSHAKDALLIFDIDLKPGFCCGVLLHES